MAKFSESKKPSKGETLEKKVKTAISNLAIKKKKKKKKSTVKPISEVTKLKSLESISEGIEGLAGILNPILVLLFIIFAPFAIPGIIMGVLMVTNFVMGKLASDGWKDEFKDGYDAITPIESKEMEKPYAFKEYDLTEYKSEDKPEEIKTKEETIELKAIKAPTMPANKLRKTKDLEPEF